MPIHDWTRVRDGIFHDFHHAWIEELARALNRGVLPPDFYALREQFAAGFSRWLGSNPAFGRRITNQYFCRRHDLEHICNLMSRGRHYAVETEHATIPAHVRYREYFSIASVQTSYFENRSGRMDRELNTRANVPSGISPRANEWMPGLGRDNFRHVEFRSV